MYIENWIAVLFLVFLFGALFLAICGWLYSADQNENKEKEIERLKRRNERLQAYAGDLSAILEAAEIPYPGRGQ